MFQFNGITMQPKFGSDFATQYGAANSTLAATTMANVTSPSAQSYNVDKVNPNMDSSKLAEKLAKNDTAHPATLPKTASKQWIG